MSACTRQLPSGEQAPVVNLSDSSQTCRPEVAVGYLHLLRMKIQIGFLQNETVESMKRIGVRNDEHLDFAHDARERYQPPAPDESPKSRPLPEIWRK